MIIFRYLSKEVYTALMATTLILLIIFISNQFVHYLNDAAGGKITVQAVMEVMSLQVPLLLGYLLPLGLFLGLLLTFGRMVVDYEMVVLSACGISRFQIVKMVLLLSSVVMVVVAWLMLWAEPKVQLYRAKIITESVKSASLEKVMPGVFQPLDTVKVFYAKSVDDNKVMHDVFFSQPVNSDAPLKAETWDIVSAESAREIHLRGGDFIMFENGHRYIGTPGYNNLKQIHFDQYGIRLGNADLSSIKGRVETLPTSELWHQSDKNLGAAAELQWRLAMPISVIGFALLAIPLSEVNPRKGKFGQILPAVLIYIIYANMMFMGRAWIIKEVVSPQLGLWWIHGAMFLLAGLLYAHQAGWRRVFTLGILRS